MTGRRVSAITAVILAALLVLGATGCTGDGSTPENAKTTEGKSKLYVALGGDDVYGGRRRLVNAWPQRLFRESLPVSETLVNLASPRHGAAEIQRDQVAVAVRLRPDLVTITLLDDLEREADPFEVQLALVAIIGRLHQVDGVRVLVGTAPPGSASPESVAAFNAAVADATRTAGAELVDLADARAADPERRAQQIADAFGQALRTG